MKKIRRSIRAAYLACAIAALSLLTACNGLGGSSETALVAVVSTSTGVVMQQVHLYGSDRACQRAAEKLRLDIDTTSRSASGGRERAESPFIVATACVPI